MRETRLLLYRLRFLHRVRETIWKQFILQVLNGLEYTHNAEIPNVKLRTGGFGKGRGLVHRDLKPSNLFLSNVNGKITGSWRVDALALEQIAGILPL